MKHFLKVVMAYLKRFGIGILATLDGAFNVALLVASIVAFIHIASATGWGAIGLFITGVVLFICSITSVVNTGEQFEKSFTFNKKEKTKSRKTLNE